MTAQIVLGFLENIWNKGAIEEAGTFLHPDFIDHSLPAGLPPDAEGLKQWVSLTSASFEHHTIIDDMVTAGYRLFWVKEGMIIAHWAMIDGSALERKLRAIS